MQERDRPAEAEVEVTQEMVAAGLKVYLDWLPDDAHRELDEGAMLAGVFRAMLLRRSALERL